MPVQGVGTCRYKGSVLAGTRGRYLPVQGVGLAGTRGRYLPVQGVGPVPIQINHSPQCNFAVTDCTVYKIRFLLN